MAGAHQGRLGRRLGLDGVRGVAILCVMALHTIDRWFPGGHVGVDVFFALSAFLITSLLLEERERNGGVNYRHFYIRRALRLGPALVLFLVTLAPVASLTINDERAVGRSTAAAAFYFANFADLGHAYAHLWSLSVEEQFYATWPVLLVGLILVATATRRLQIFVGLFVASFLVVAVTNELWVANYVYPTGHLVPFAGGALAAYLFISGASATTWFRSPVVGGAALAVIGGLVVLSKADTWSGSAAGVCAVALILHVCASSGGPVRAALETPIAVWFGRRSYGLYLFHSAIFVLLPGLWHGLPLRVNGPLSAVVACAAARVVVALRRASHPDLGTNSTGSCRGKTPGRVTVAARPSSAILPRLAREQEDESDDDFGEGQASAPSHSRREAEVIHTSRRVGARPIGEVQHPQTDAHQPRGHLHAPRLRARCGSIVVC